MSNARHCLNTPSASSDLGKVVEMAGRYHSFTNWAEHKAYLQFMDLSTRLLESGRQDANEVVYFLIRKMEKMKPELASRALETYEHRRSGDENLRLLRRLFLRFEALDEKREGSGSSELMKDLLRKAQKVVNDRLADMIRIKYNAGIGDGNYGPSEKEFKLGIRRGEPEANRYYAS